MEQLTLSTPARDKLSRALDIPRDRCFVVLTEQEGLADFVRRMRREKKLSLADVHEQSGREIARSHVNRIENGETENLGLDKLRALARGLGVGEEEIFAVASGITRGESDAFDSEIRVAFQGFEELTDEDKRELLATVRMLGSEIQRRRPKPQPAKKPGGKKR
jgi:transcriptional regulator with XRE-family HTH domain